MQALQTRPKVKYVCDELERLATDLGAGGQLPTMVQLRDLLGVSMKTLHDSMREMERRGVLRSVHGVGIFVEEPARKVITGNLGVMLAAQQSAVQNLSYFGLILSGVRQEAAKLQKDVLLIDNYRPFQNWEKLDGLIVSDMRDPRDGAYGLQSIPAALPKVAILSELPGIRSVTSDDYLGTSLLAGHLVRLGHKRIAYLGSQSESISTVQERLRGYKDTMAAAGLPVDSRWLRELRYRPEWSTSLDWMFRGAQAHMAEWLTQDWRSLGCTALVTQNDQAAFGAISALRLAGYRVPEDVSVTGYDAIPTENDLLPSLTTIRVPLEEIGRQAARLTLSEPNQFREDLPGVLLPVELITGSSTASTSK